MRKLILNNVWVNWFLFLQEDDEDDEDDSDNNDFADRQYYARRHLLLEIEIYCYLLVIIFLMNAERYEEVFFNIYFII